LSHFSERVGEVAQSLVLFYNIWVCYFWGILSTEIPIGETGASCHIVYSSR